MGPSKKGEIFKRGLEICKRDWKFQASHPPIPNFCGEFCRSGLNFSSKIEFRDFCGGNRPFRDGIWPSRSGVQLSGPVSSHWTTNLEPLPPSPSWGPDAITRRPAASTGPYFSSESAFFNRDWTFSSFGPLGQGSRLELQISMLTQIAAISGPWKSGIMNRDSLADRTAFPEGPKIKKNRDFERDWKFRARMKFSSATHYGPFLWGNRDVEIEIFERD